MMRRLALWGFLLLAFGAQSMAAQNCSLTFTNMSFGTYTGNQLNSPATGTVKCSNAWNIPLDAGTGANATITNRKMTGPGGATLNYQIFQHGTTTIWGDTTATEVSGTGSKTVTADGLLSAGQYPVPGTYTDTIHSATTHFTVTAVVQATCLISANTLAFGNYSGVQLDSTSTLSLTCTNTTSFNVSLDAGQSTGATVNTRKMKGTGTATLSYSLFRDGNRTLNWGKTVGTDTLHATGTGAAAPYTVYGRIPAGTVPAAGTYTDTIVATVTY